MQLTEQNIEIVINIVFVVIDASSLATLAVKLFHVCVLSTPLQCNCSKKNIKIVINIIFVVIDASSPATSTDELFHVCMLSTPT